jgi:translation initiation factor IF-3
MNIRDAQQKANSLNLDLVEISPQANPPVCKIMNFDKFKYREQKRAQELKRKQQRVHLKELKLRPNTDDHDYQIRIKRAKEFLEEGHKVKFAVQFRGREITHQEFGLEYLQKTEKDLYDISVVEQPIKTEGRSMSVIFAPKKHNKVHHED